MVIEERTVGAALRGRPARNSVLGGRRVAEIEFHAGRPRRAAPTVRSSMTIPLSSEIMESPGELIPSCVRGRGRSFGGPSTIAPQLYLHPYSYSD